MEIRRKPTPYIFLFLVFLLIFGADPQPYDTEATPFSDLKTRESEKQEKQKKSGDQI